LTSTEYFAKQAEPELRNSRRISADTCKLWDDLDDEGRRAFAQAVDFLCEARGASGAGTDPTLPTRQVDRWAASRLMLLMFRLDTADPVWSSYALSRYVQAVLNVPGGSLCDVFIPVLRLLGESGPELTRTVANFVKELVIYCFTTFRSAYESLDWTVLIRTLGTRPTAAQCYFALQATPPENVTPQMAAIIENALASSDYAKEAQAALST